MPFLNDVEVGALAGDDADAQVRAIARQLNDWGRSISNENKTKLYKDNSGKNRIIIGELPDGTHGLVVSKEGIDVLDVFS